MTRSSSPDPMSIFHPQPPLSPASSTPRHKNLTLPRRNPKADPETGKKLPAIFRTQPKGGRCKDKGKIKMRAAEMDRRRTEFFSCSQKRKRDSGQSEGSANKEGKENEGVSRARVTEMMMRTLGKKGNPITDSDVTRPSDHVVSCATGHQRAEQRGPTINTTYAQVRTAQLENQSRAKRTGLFRGCLFYFNGSTGPKVSNLQLRNLISENGGRFTTIQTSSCTHIIANSGLSGGKTQKHLDMQGGRRSSRQARVIRVEWVLDSVDRGVKLSEAGYGMVENPSQPNLFDTLGVKPKSYSSGLKRLPDT